MTPRRKVLVVVLCCFLLPAIVVVADGAIYYSANRTSGTIRIAGEDREYIVHVPRGHDASTPAALVLSLHGAGTWPSMQMNLSGWNQLADRHGFIAAYPGGGGSWLKVFHDPKEDLMFFAALLDELTARYNIDKRRIYANGLSNGGGVSYALSCFMSDRFAAVGAVAPAVTMSPDLCPKAKPVPAVVFHGTGDQSTPYHGGKVFIAPKPFPSIPTWIGNWAHRNGCGATPTEKTVAADVSLRQYDDCTNNATVALYTIDGGGHTWPGGQDLTPWLLGPTNRSISASEIMWEFFKQHPMVP